MYTVTNSMIINAKNMNAVINNGRVCLAEMANVYCFVSEK